MRCFHGSKAVMLGAVVLCGIVVVSVASAKQPAQEQAPRESVGQRPEVKLPPNAYALSQATMRAFLDPQTGKLREPSAEELAELGRAAGRVRSSAEAAISVFDLPSGGIGAEVPAELMSYSLVSLGKDGAVEFECHDGELDHESLPAPPAVPAGAEVQ